MGKFYKKSAIFAALTLLCMPLVACGGARYKDGAKAPAANASAGVAVPATASVWNGDLAAAGWGGNVAAPDTYVLNASAKTLEIGSAAALAYFSHEVYADKDAHALDGYNVKLTCDIDLGGDENIWIPIGTTGRSNIPTWRFAGTFDGDGHTIYNLTSAGFYDNVIYNNGDDKGYYVNYTGESAIKIPFELKDGKEFCYGLFGTTANFTAKNLNMSGVKFDIKDFQPENAPNKLISDGIGAVVGYGVGSIKFENCSIGTSGDIIEIDATDNPALGGLVGRVYSYNHDGIGVTAPYQSISFDNCVNNTDFKYTGASGKIGGIVGYVQFFDECIIDNCVNYGNIGGGQYVGGITSYWSNQDENAPWIFKILNCDNYGDVATDNNGSGKDSGGIIGQLRGADDNSGAVHTQVTITVENCNNYGNVSGYHRVGGIMAWFRNTSGCTTDITDCFNYGDVSGLGNSASVGGCFSAFDVYYGSPVTPGKLVMSCVNSGKVTGTPDKVGGVYGSSNAGEYAEVIFAINAVPIGNTTVVVEGGTAETSATLALSEDGKTVLGLDGVPEG